MHGRNKQKYEATDLHTKGIESSQKDGPHFRAKNGHLSQNQSAEWPEELLHLFLPNAATRGTTEPPATEPAIRNNIFNNSPRAPPVAFPPPLNSTGQPFWGLFQLFHPRPIGWSIPNIHGPNIHRGGFCDKPREYPYFMRHGNEASLFFYGWAPARIQATEALYTFNLLTPCSFQGILW